MMKTIKVVDVEEIDKKITFTGKVIGVTKVKNDEGMAFRLTIDKGVYIEINNAESTIFKHLCGLVDLENEIEITIEKR
jgi:hypothetical protein